MSSFFLYHRTTSPTGRLLARALGVPYGHLGRGQTPRRARNVQSSLTRATALIRWGSQQALPSGCRPTSTLNSVEALSRSSDKAVALRVLMEQGVRVPRFSLASDASTLRELRESVPVILGRSRHGSQGRDIRVFQEGEPLHGSELYTEYIPNTREYRLHVFQGEVIRVQGKYLDFKEQHTNPFIKNHGQGFRFRAPDRQLNADRLESAIGAVRALGLDFGAVDLLIGEDRLAYVLEVNTAPACSPLTARAYIERFAEWLGIEPTFAGLTEAPAQGRVLAAVGG